MTKEDRIKAFEELVYFDKEDLIWLQADELVDLLDDISKSWVSLKDYLI